MQWEDLPREKVAAIEQQFGRIIKAEPVSGGLMPGLSAVLHAEDGQRWFLKAVPPDSPARHLFERELTANAGLPEGAPAPRLRHARDTGWIVLVFDHVDGRHADLSPGSPDLSAVIGVLQAVSASAAWDDTPGVAGHVTGLQVKAARLLASHPDGELSRLIAAATDAFDVRELAGPRLVHYDLHPGNLLVTGGGAVAVDWSFACKGAAWIDAALLVPRLIAAGHSPADAEFVVSALPAWRSASAAAVTGLAACWTAFRAYKALYGPEPARETRAQAARAGQAWVQHRMDTRAGR